MNNKRSAARQGGPRAPRARFQGYSVLELMLAVSIASALAAVGVPAFTNLTLDSHRTTLTNELLGGLLLARSEAVKRGQNVIVCGLSDANRNGVLDPFERRCAGRDWTDGWMLGAWDDVNHDNAVGADEVTALRIFLTGESGRMTVTTGNFTATPPVAPAGTAVMKIFGRRSNNGTITICDRRGSRQARAIIISPNGRARVSARRSDGSALICP